MSCLKCFSIVLWVESSKGVEMNQLEASASGSGGVDRQLVCPAPGWAGTGCFSLLEDGSPSLLSLVNNSGLQEAHL